MRIVAAFAACAAILLPLAAATISEYSFVTAQEQKFESVSLLGAFATKSRIYCSGQCAAKDGCSLVSYSATLQSCELYALGSGTYSFTNDGAWDTHFKALDADVTSAITGVYEDVNGVRILSGQREKLDNVTVPRVLSANQCQIICQALTGDCGVFSYNDVTGDCLVIFINFYDDWTWLDTSQTGWTGYYKINQGTQKLLFKANSGTGVDMSTTFVDPGHASAIASYMQMATNSTCGCSVKSDVLENWSKFPITQISIHFFTGGVDSGFITFDASGATVSTFFVLSRLLSSKWTDLKTNTAGLTVDIGNAATNQGRNFYVQQVKKCTDDQCWFAVDGTSAGDCSYSTTAGRPPPQFGYVSKTTREPCKNMLWADTFVVYGML